MLNTRKAKYSSIESLEKDDRNNMTWLISVFWKFSLIHFHLIVIRLLYVDDLFSEIFSWTVLCGKCETTFEIQFAILNNL